MLAGLSPDYNSRLEQGRQANISDDVLDALARALRLDEVEHAHLRDLAAPTSRSRAVIGEAVQRPEPFAMSRVSSSRDLPEVSRKVLRIRWTLLATRSVLPRQGASATASGPASAHVRTAEEAAQNSARGVTGSVGTT